jgi:L-arabinonolactonase
MTPERVPVECVAQTNDVLGESAWWDAEGGAFWWADLFKPALHRLDPTTGAVESWTPPEKLCSMALRRRGGLILATRAGIAFYDPPTGAFEIVARPEADRPGNMMNDGKCDRRGRFWVGSMDKSLETVSGRLYRIDADRAAHVMAEDIELWNGTCFSPDDRTLYFADSRRRAIFACDLDIDEGTVRNRRRFVSTEDVHGVPDGATVDADGCLWSCQFESGTIRRYAPDGRLDRVLALPVSRPTSCSFGGEKLDRLYVTTATFRLPPEKRAQEKGAGGVLALEVGVRGLPEPRFAG